MLVLREFQEQIIEQARRHMLAGRKSILILSPTGSGKTVLTAHMLKTSADKGMASFFNVHRRELVKQSIRTFAMVGVRHGVVSAGFLDDPRHAVQICSVQTLVRRYHKMTPPKLIIWDEAHHIAAAGWAQIFEAFPKSFHIGLTATPERLDGTGLGKWFEVMVQGPTVSWLIEEGFLSPYVLYGPSTPAMDGVHTRMGDFVKSELAVVMDRPSVTGDAIKEYTRHAAGKRAVIFCNSVEHSKHVVNQFAAAGFRAEHVDGETPSDLRDCAIKRFESGQTQVLCNVDLFGEGFDLPTLEVSILLRPTQSLALYLQQCGRALRPVYAPGFDLSTKEGRKAAIQAGPKPYAVILDHAGNWTRHGLPDQERAWSLEGRVRQERGKKDQGVPVKVCPKCFAAQFPGKPACLYCGTVFELKARVIDHVEGDLAEVTKDHVVRRPADAERGQAKTLKELEELGRQRGYKRPMLWAKHVYNGRRAKRAKGG